MGTLNIDDGKLKTGLKNLQSTAEGRATGAIMGAVFCAAKASIGSMATNGGEIQLTQGELMCLLSYMENEITKINSPKQMADALKHGVSVLSAAVDGGVAEGLIFSHAGGVDPPANGGLKDFVSFFSEAEEDG